MLRAVRHKGDLLPVRRKLLIEINTRRRDQAGRSADGLSISAKLNSPDVGVEDLPHIGEPTRRVGNGQNGTGLSDRFDLAGFARLMNRDAIQTAVKHIA